MKLILYNYPGLYVALRPSWRSSIGGPGLFGLMYVKQPGQAGISNKTGLAGHVHAKRLRANRAN